jgi:hypothetical protein
VDVDDNERERKRKRRREADQPLKRGEAAQPADVWNDHFV